MVGLMQSLFSMTALYVAAVLFLVLVASQLHSWHRLRHIPGPLSASLSVHWLLRKALGGSFHEDFIKIADQYGPLVRIGPNDLLASDPDVLRKMSAVRSPYRKGTFYETGRIIPGENNVVSLRDDDLHKTLRAKLSPAYLARENESYSFEAGIDRQVMKFMNLIETSYVSTPDTYRPLDLAEKAQFFALDAIGDIGFGSAFGFLAHDMDLHRYIEITDSSLPVLNVLSTMPWLTNVVHKWPFTLVLPKDGDELGFGRLMGFAKNFVDDRLVPGAKPGKDMMQAFINNGLTRPELIQQTFVQIIAGSISTATAIRMTILCLLNTPTAYVKLRHEIDNGVASGFISSPITNAEALKLPYLQAVIRESLRMYPPVTGMGCKQVPKGGDVINGYFVPEGTQIGHNFPGMTRSKKIWGGDADVFRPERWTEANAEQLRAMTSVVDLDFGSGKYQCLGKGIAMMELNKVFVEMIQRFDLAIVNPLKPLSAKSAVFWVLNDFWLRVTKREDASLSSS